MRESVTVCDVPMKVYWTEFPDPWHVFEGADDEQEAVATTQLPM